MISVNLLNEFGAVTRIFKKNDHIIHEGYRAKFYFQVINGEVKMCNIGDDGQEFIQGMFQKGESFGEPPLFLNKFYPASAIAVTDCEIIVLERSKLLSLLKGHNEVQIELMKVLSSKLYFKSMMSKEITLHAAGHRIITLIDFLKNRDGAENTLYAVALTRQQIADLTGLRVETVIRTMRHLIQEKQLQKKQRKIFR
jgi:CRP-like cAMP-binding protein